MNVNILVPFALLFGGFFVDLSFVFSCFFIVRVNSLFLNIFFNQEPVACDRYDTTCRLFT